MSSSFWLTTLKVMWNLHFMRHIEPACQIIWTVRSALGFPLSQDLVQSIVQIIQPCWSLVLSKSNSKMRTGEMSLSDVDVSWCYWLRERKYILRALLVSGLSPSTRRILTSVEHPPDNNLKIASPRRRMWTEPSCFPLTSPLLSPAFPIPTPPQGYRLRALEPLDKHETSVFADTDPEAILAGFPDVIFRWWQLR